MKWLLWCCWHPCASVTKQYKLVPARGRWHGLLGPHESAPKHYLDRFGRFGTVHPCDQHTHTDTDHATSDICRNRPHLCYHAMRSKVVICCAFTNRQILCTAPLTGKLAVRRVYSAVWALIRRCLQYLASPTELFHLTGAGDNEHGIYRSPDTRGICLDFYGLPPTRDAAVRVVMWSLRRESSAAAISRALSDSVAGPCARSTSDADEIRFARIRDNAARSLAQQSHAPREKMNAQTMTNMRINGPLIADTGKRQKWRQLRTNCCSIMTSRRRMLAFRSNSRNGSEF